MKLSSEFAVVIVVSALVSGCGDSPAPQPTRLGRPKAPSTAEAQSDTVSLQTKSDVLPGIQAFLAKHKEFGLPSRTQSVPNWAQGKRQRVQFKTGRNLLFYLKNGKVVTVYEDTKTGSRKKVWGSQGGSAEYAKDISRPATGAIPNYTIISAINLLAGGKHADVLIPSLSSTTPREMRSKVAFAILKKEGLKSLGMYSTQEAYKADYSSSYAKQHPSASKGRLGSISMEGQFND
ncbi:MAG: hypothetical protein ISS29_01055 [Candidatus Marinimicrobia bacterium]|nr:hypothetical protein [Candidatus Neomarinimicrobiota bacterium]